MQAQVLLASSNSIPFPQHDPLIHKRLFYSLTFGHVREYFRVVRVLASFSPTPTSSNTTLVNTALHFKLDGYFPLFLEDYKLDWDLKLSSDSFKLVFQRMLHLSINGPSGMVLNTFGTIFTLNIQQVNSFSCSNFVFILHRVTFYFKLHVSLEQLTF